MIVGTVVDHGHARPLHVVSLAQQYASWSSTRQAVIAGNIANADTPGYKAQDLEPFKALQSATRLQLHVTNANHMALSPMQVAAADAGDSDPWDVTHSSNTVSLDEELAKADEVGRGHDLAVSVMDSFHRMLLSSVSFR